MAKVGPIEAFARTQAAVEPLVAAVGAG